MDLNQLVGNNQSIKVVQSIEDSLQSLTGLNTELDVKTTLWLEQLKQTWKTWKKGAALENHVELFFDSVEDPFRIALVFVMKCEYVKDCKPKTLPFFIIKTLQKWSQTQPLLLDDSLKLPAFHIATQQRNYCFLDLVLKTYQVNTVKETILPFIRDMIKNDNSKQASFVVLSMKMFDDIPVEDILFPLVLLDEVKMIDEYLLEAQNHVRPFLSFLDKLLDKSMNIREYVQKYIEENKVTHIKYTKIHYKPLGKLVARLCKKFNVPLETCKNLSKNRTTSGLKYLVYKKYEENGVSSSQWDDLVKDSLRLNAEAGKEFIDILIDFDKHEARKWASYLNIPNSALPLALRDMPESDLSVDENWDTTPSASEEYYKLVLPEDKIIMVDTAEKFYETNVILEKCQFVGIDSEWKPSFGAKQSQIALIQISTLSTVYLIDSVVLNKPAYASVWTQFHKCLLGNPEIVKIGFGLEQDLKEIRSSIISLANMKLEGEGFLDLSSLWKLLLNSGLNTPNQQDNTGNSLSSLVQICFGLPLEKSEQCTNWELRPLRKTQIQYAALDAYVLIQLYEHLKNRCLIQNINFEDACNNAMLDSKKKSTKSFASSKKSAKICEISNSLQAAIIDPNKHTIDNLTFPSEIKMLVEPQLSNLMCYLRYCGIDTIAMQSNMLWHDIINFAISEDRIVALIKAKGTPTSNFPQSSIFVVGKGSIKDQVHKIFTTYKIESNGDMCRCIYCNYKDLKHLTSDEVNNLCRDYQEVINTSTAVTHADQYYNYDESESQYSDFYDSDHDEDLYQPVNVNNKKKITTSKGVPIVIESVQELSLSNKPAVLCEACGKLFWDEDILLKSVRGLVHSLLNITL